MKVFYYSYGSDLGGKYDVSVSIPSLTDTGSSVLESLLPVPAVRNDGLISLAEAANMAIQHTFDSGTFGVVEAPESNVSVDVEGYIVTFNKDKSFDIKKNPEWEKRQKVLREKEETLGFVCRWYSGHSSVRFVNKIEPKKDEISDGETFAIGYGERKWNYIHNVQVVLEKVSVEHFDHVMKTIAEIPIPKWEIISAGKSYLGNGQVVFHAPSHEMAAAHLAGLVWKIFQEETGEFYAYIKSNKGMLDQAESIIKNLGKNELIRYKRERKSIIQR